MSKNKRNYTDEFKNDAIRLALKSSAVSEAADRLGIPGSTLNTWLRKEGIGNKGNSDPNTINLSDELKQLRKENARLREEREILKKAATFFAKEAK